MRRVIKFIGSLVERILGYMLAIMFAFFINAYMEVYNSKLTIVAAILLILTYYFCYTLSLNAYKNTDF